MNMIPVKMREADIDVLILFLPSRNEIPSKISDATSGIENGYIPAVPGKQQARGVPAELLKFTFANRKRASRAVKFDFHDKRVSRKSNKIMDSRVRGNDESEQFDTFSASC
ncbi:MAG: hypothetical protein ACREOO_18270 [bacterium]